GPRRRDEVGTAQVIPSFPAGEARRDAGRRDDADLAAAALNRQPNGDPSLLAPPASAHAGEARLRKPAGRKVQRPILNAVKGRRMDAAPSTRVREDRTGREHPEDPAHVSSACAPPSSAPPADSRESWPSSRPGNNPRCALAPDG